MSPDATAYFDTATTTVSCVDRDPSGRAGAIDESVLNFDPVAGRSDMRRAGDITRSQKIKMRAGNMREPEDDGDIFL